MGIVKSSFLPLVLVSLSLTGCFAPHSDTKVQVVSDYSVQLDAPLVKVDKSGITTITGMVRRLPTATGVLTGRVDVDFLGVDGDVLNDEPLTIGLNPPKIPTDPKSASSYSINWCYIPPPGATVRVQFVDSQTAANEDASGRNPTGGNANTGGGHHGGGGIRTGSVGHNW